MAEAEDFTEILGAEMLVDITRLKEAASHGIPEEVRWIAYTIWLCG